VAEKGLNIVALSHAVCGEDCVVRLVTDDNLRATDALRAARYAPHEENVVLVELPHKPGMLRRVVEALAEEGIDVHHIFATAAEGPTQSLLLFRSSNDAHALLKLKTLEAEEHAAASIRD